MPIIDLLSAVIGGAASLAGREAIRFYRRPRISLDLYDAKRMNPYVITRTLDEGPIDYAGRQVTQRKIAKDVHLLVENHGYRPVRGCEATMDIYEEEKEIPKPVRLGWRKRPPVLYQNLDFGEAMRQRTAPFDINRKSQAQLDLLRLQCRLIEDAETGEIVDRNVDKLTTLSSFRNHNFDADTEYRLDITVTASNTDPEDISLRLHWDGTIDDAALREAVSVASEDIP